MELKMDKPERDAAERFALESALSLLVTMLDEKGVLPRREFRDELTKRGTGMVMNSMSPFSEHVGREMAEIAKRII